MDDHTRAIRREGRGTPEINHEAGTSSWIADLAREAPTNRRRLAVIFRGSENLNPRGGGMRLDGGSSNTRGLLKRVMGSLPHPRRNK